MGKKVLIIGQGGREHALAWKLAQSADIEKIYAAPGNPGIAALAECIDISAEDIEGLLAFAVNQQIDLTVVGPEVPLTLGVTDRFREKGLKIFGPTADAARLESSKIFTKKLLQKYNIPTAEFMAFDSEQPACEFACSLIKRGGKAVIKADGLAAGKGVVIVSSQEEVNRVLEEMMVNKSLGTAGEQVVVEECLVGEEVSVFVISDGQDYVPLLAAQDHKQVYDNDEGPNTGGMGAYVHPPVYNDKLRKEVEENIIEPVIKGMADEGCPFQGVLYTGLMITKDGPKVLEFNVRFGDPEAQVIMPMLQSDILPLLERASEGRLAGVNISLEEGNCVAVILASRGYPAAYEKGKVITGLDILNPETLVFHAGTAWRDGQLVTSGGRVMAVVSRGKNINESIAKVYAEVDKIHFEGMHYRTDIGHKALSRGN